VTDKATVVAVVIVVVDVDAGVSEASQVCVCACYMGIRKHPATTNAYSLSEQPNQ